ncbi:MAG: 1,4-dihydroxy-2-naphthoate octaprenyltransferase [Candidatus Caldarchaeum sp.]|nr:1,4-dihydroxy-2-naphthoate octaprenyltransferase [Candidatus Caldarchaeum sp.]
MTAELELEKFTDVVVSYVDDDGYPMSYSTTARKQNGKLVLEKPTYLKPKKQMTVLLNHITPLPTGGYTDRRYLMMKGEAEILQDRVVFTPRKSYGWDEKTKPFFQYCEENVPQAKSYLRKLSESVGREVKARLPTLQLLFRATRFPFLSATAAPVLIGVGSATYLGYFDFLLFILTIVGASLIHLGLNTANDYFDSKLGADEKNIQPTPFSGGSRIIQYGLLTSRQVATMSALFYAVALVIGLYLAFTRGLIPILTLMALGVFISYAYTAPPFKLAYRGVGEIAVGVGFGPVIVLGSHFVQTQQFTAEAVLASIPIGILIALILYINEIPDSPYDAAAGKRTLVTRLNKAQVLNIYKILLGIAYALIVASVLLQLAPPTALIALITIPRAVKAVKLVDQTYGNPYLMIPALASNIQVATFTGFLHAAGFFAWAVIQLFAR